MNPQAQRIGLPDPVVCASDPAGGGGVQGVILPAGARPVMSAVVFAQLGGTRGSTCLFQQARPGDFIKQFT